MDNIEHTYVYNYLINNLGIEWAQRFALFQHVINKPKDTRYLISATQQCWYSVPVQIEREKQPKQTGSINIYTKHIEKVNT